jgi:hypothetical protein
MANPAGKKAGERGAVRRYCFVIMPYRSLGLFYEHLRQQIKKVTGLDCIRADEVPGAGQSLLNKIQDLITRAELVVVDISEQSPNVYYEAGFAAAMNKKVLVVCCRDTPIPTDLQGMERLEYHDTLHTLPEFDEQLRKHLLSMVDNDIGLLRAMLVAPDHSPCYVLASPRATSKSKIKGAAPRFLEWHTHGDNLGVVGILSALGLLLGEEERPELLSAWHVKGELLRLDANFYLVASPLSNPLTADAMAMLQQHQPHPWRLSEESKGKVQVLSGERHGEPWEFRAHRDLAVPKKAYGIVIAGPHPRHRQRRIVVMAGTRSFGTGAACLAATRPRLIQEIKNRLTDVELGDPTKTIWALVYGTPDRKEGRLTEDMVVVDDVGVIASARNRSCDSSV